MLALSLFLAVAFAQDTAYFQQRVAYRIEARLDESAEVLNGRLRLEYRNNAPVSIDTLWFHLHLNAFRPNSAWARRDLEFGERRFTDLGPNDHAFERVRRVEIGGASIAPLFPGAPDSTVMAVPLPRPVAPGGTVTVDIDWDARPSTLPRRQGRRGRHYDFAQWYPRIAVFDRGGWRVQPLMPQGEFYGEFGSYDITLDLAADQVVGATGVPVEGEPGWAAAAAVPGTRPDLRRNAYPPTTAARLGLVGNEPASGRKHVRWRAEDVHHFAWTTNPEYIYEGGALRDIAVHVLYQPGDSSWANAVAVNRTAAAIAWFEGIFGPYPWPQITNVHRIEGGGTEFPMMVMDGSASEGLIFHEVGHNFVHGILANNEWLEGWMDEGFVSYLTSWAAEESSGRRGNWSGSLNGIRRLDREGRSQPIALASADFRDFQTYNAMTYTKPSLVFRMLHWLVGDAAFRDALRRYYAERRLQHVNERDLRAAVSAAAGENMDWFFEQWVHTTGTLDYSIGELSTRQEGGTWVSRVEVIREGTNWMPVELRVGDTVQRLTSREPRQIVMVRTAARPDAATLDPDNILIDLEPSNNAKEFPR